MQKLKWIIAMFIVIILGTYIVLIGEKNQVNKELDIEEANIVSEELVKVVTAKQYTTYTVELSVDEECNSFEGIVQILYAHEYEKATEQIVMNADSIRIKDVQMNSDTVAFEQIGSELLIQSPFIIKKDEEVTITIQFQGSLMGNKQNMTNTASIYNFLPTILTYDEYSGWVRTSHTEIDSSRLIEPANYEVTVHTYGDKYPIGTGTMNDISENNNMITTSFSAKRVRGFGLFIGPKMEREIFNTQEGSSVVLYHAAGTNIQDELIPTITKSLSSYSDTFGTYPYDQLTVIQKSGIRESSYPTLITGDFRRQEPIYNDINKLIGKQWLYYIIGNSNEKECWLSTGLLEYLNKRFSFSQGQMEAYIEEQRKIEEEKKIDDPKGKNYIYSHNEIAIRMFYEIEEKIGEEKFIEALRTYYKNYSFQMATGREFIQIIGEVSGVNVMNIYNFWLHKMESRESDEYESNCTSSG